MLKPDYIAWLDLETTGSALATSQILEVGIVLTDMKLNEIAAASWLNTSPLPSLRITDVDPVVLEMHVKNGLWKDLQEAVESTRYTVDDDITGWLRNHTHFSSKHIALAGSGVSHFDRPFIVRDLPKTNKMLTYWSLDVGVVRRFRQLAGIEDLSFVDTKTHRAKDDAYSALSEARALLKPMMQVVRP